MRPNPLLTSLLIASLNLPLISAKPLTATPHNSSTPNAHHTHPPSSPAPATNTSSTAAASPSPIPISPSPFLDQEINCQGSPLGCLGASSGHTMRVLRDYMSHLTAAASYYANQHIACIEHRILSFPVAGYYCAFLQGGGVPAGGVNGVMLVRMMERMIEGGCEGCGSCGIEEGDKGEERGGEGMGMGILTVNYVADSQCVGLCVYASGADRKPLLAWTPGRGVVAVD